KRPIARKNLANAELVLGRSDDAIAEYRRALALDPRLAEAHENLGQVLYRTDRFEEAAEELRKAIALDPDSAEAHCGLGLSLKHVGQFQEALAELGRADELGSKDPNFANPTAEWIEGCEALARTEAHLDRVAAGEDSIADASDAVDLARVAHAKRRYAAAVRC